ncbi:EF-hand calcium-binding domain-containing protein 9 [Discoglossus pictus]
MAQSQQSPGSKNPVPAGSVQSFSLGTLDKMKLRTHSFLQYLYLDKLYCLMSVRNANVLVKYFQLLDVHNKNTLNDIQFFHFLHYSTNLTKKEIMQVFDMLDWNGVGEIGFDEFYMLVCILICNEEKMEKQFIHRHSRTVFDLLDMDGKHTISLAEFMACGLLFNIKRCALNKIFTDFHVSRDEHLSHKEFKMYAICCIEKEEAQKKGINKDPTEDHAPKQHRMASTAL